MIQKHGMSYLYHHDNWVRWLRKKQRMPEEATYKALYGFDVTVPSVFTLNEQISKLYYLYKYADISAESFRKYVNKNIEDDSIFDLDLDKAYLNLSKLEINLTGPLSPILGKYKNIYGFIDSIYTNDRNATAFINFWLVPIMNVPEAIELSSHYAFNRCKLVFIDHGLRIRNIHVYFPVSNIGYTIKMNYQYPLEVMIEMAAAGLTLGGQFGRLPFKTKSISGLRIPM